MALTSLRRDVLLVSISVLVAVSVAIPAAAWWAVHSLGSSTSINASSEGTEIERSQDRTPTREATIWDPALFAPPTNPEETIEAAEDALIEVWCGEDYSGTGWVIETDRQPIVRASQRPMDGDLFDGVALTAWHVVEDCTGGGDEMVVYRGRSTIPALLLNWQKKNDIAVLSVEIARPGLRVDTEAPTGTWVMTTGYPLSEDPTPVFGNVIAKEEFQIYTQMPIRPGHSGSPLVNSLGKAIGIVTSVPLDEESGEPYGWAISTSVVALCEKLFSCPAGDIEGLDE